MLKRTLIGHEAFLPGLFGAVTSVSDCRSRGMSLIQAPSHTLVEIDHEIISMVNHCQLKAKVCAQLSGQPLVQG